MVDKNEYFREAVLRICATLDVEQALSGCFDYFRQFFPVDEISFTIYERENGAIYTIASAPAWGAGSGHVSRFVKLSDEARRNLNGREVPEVKIVNDEGADIVTKEVYAAMGKTGRWCSLIMRTGISGRRVGALVIASPGRDVYTEEHAQLLFMLNDPLSIAFSNCLEHQEVIRLRDHLSDDNRYLRSELSRLSGGEIVGVESGLRVVMEMARRVAPLSCPVLLFGETGVGKEIIANEIQYKSARREGPFIKINCGAIPETLIDSELFGHEKGAFTGAVLQRRGRFERAHKGTIFLDEVGELPTGAQVRLLRVLQNKEIERVGGSGPQKVDVRVIAATNRDLRAMVASGDFRKDLWFRLNVFPIVIPPLRERRRDIPRLVHFFLDQKCRDMNIKKVPRLADRAMDRLSAYDWPGNVRELENAVERELILTKENRVLLFESLEASETASVLIDGTTDSFNFEKYVGQLIKRVLCVTGGRVEGAGGAAQLLGINPSTLRSRMRKLGIPYGKSSALTGSA